jgi:hypothetical protein
MSLLRRHAVYPAMSIDKESSGMPEIDVGRRTTKVNFGTMIGVVLFLAVGAAVIIWYASHHS